MIKQDYIIRMIQSIISALAEVLLKLQDHFSEDPEKWEKLELAAMKMLQIAEESEDHLLKSRLRQNGLDLLKTVQSQANSFSL